MPNQQPFDDWMQFINKFTTDGEQVLPDNQELYGFILRSPVGDIIIELDGDDVSISINDVQVVRLDCNLKNEEITIKAYNYNAPTNKHEYEQLIDLKPDAYAGDRQKLHEFIQVLQKSQNFITLEVASNLNKDACVLVKIVDETVNTNDFQVLYIPNNGSTEQAMYDVVHRILSAPNLQAGINAFQEVCHKLLE